MGERIELPQTPQGTAEEQMRQMYSYLYRVAEALNHNLSEIGSMDLTDDERIIMQQITAEEEGAEAAAYDWQGKESLKSLIIKTAAFVQNKLDNYRLNLLGEYVTEGKFGKYVRNTSLKVDVTPTGIQQDFTFEEVVQGLKNYTVNAKNYIKTGLLRMVGGAPVYGVAIGKDVVTFSQDGTETYNDGNKVAELTADELSFYQSGNKVASYKGNRISFFSGNTEVMYIQNGEIVTTGALKIQSGGSFYVSAPNFEIDSAEESIIVGDIIIGKGYGGIRDVNTDAGTDSQIMFSNGLALGTVFNNPVTSVWFGIDFDPYTNEAHMGDENNNGRYSPLRIFPVEVTPPYMYNNGILGTALTPWKEAHILTVYNSSSREIKHDIQQMPDMGETLDRLRPVTFIYDNDPEEKKRYGLIYEEAIDALPDICSCDESAKAINYTELIPVLLAEIQSLRQRVKALEEREDN